MKKIKATAILLAMTLTFSMFATAASAADVTLCSGEYESIEDVTGAYSYSEENFKATLANANYAALFNFDSETATYLTEVNTAIVGAGDNDKCTLGITPSTANCVSLRKNSSGNTIVASGTQAMGITRGTSATFSISSTDDTLKPVAIGFYVFSDTNKVDSAVAADLTVTLSGGTTETNEWKNANAKNTSLRFYGYKAPLGKYIESIQIAVPSHAGTSRVRFDDLCIIYDDVSRINTGVRFYKNGNTEVDFYDVTDLKNSTIGGSVWTEVSSEKYTGKKIIMAVYDGNELMDVKTTDDLSVGNGLSAGQIDRLTKIKTFIWDMNTLVPAGPAATLE